jgi:hypothetical protein
MSQVQASVCIVEDLKLEPIRAKLASCLDAKDVIAQILGANEQEKMRCVDLLSVWWRVRNKCNVAESTSLSDSVCHVSNC